MLVRVECPTPELPFGRPASAADTGSFSHRLPGIGPHARSSNRARRVVLLLVGILVLSLADLVLTVTHLRTVGMIEANPIAAFLIRSTQSWVVLSLYKGLTVGVCVVLLYRARHSLISEAACWFGFGVLSVIALLWHEYSVTFEQHELIHLVQRGLICDQWLRLD